MFRGSKGMVVNKIQIKDFTVFKDFEVDFSEGVNLFIGENGTGKTHLLKILYSYLSGHGYEKVLRCKKEELCNSPRSSCKLTVNEITEDIPSHGFDNDVDVRTDNIFVPAKDMLTHSKTIAWLARDYRKTMAFDQTLIDIVHKALRPHPDNIPELARIVADMFDITEVIGGEVIEDNEEFFIRNTEDKKDIRFYVVAEGHKKLGLLWQLLMNGSITKDSIILWDEPEANIHPQLISDLVEVMLELSRRGMQIFIATHDYVFSKYVEVKMKSTDGVKFHALHHTDEGLKIESQSRFTSLENNGIIAETVKLYKEELKKVME